MMDPILGDYARNNPDARWAAEPGARLLPALCTTYLFAGSSISRGMGPAASTFSPTPLLPTGVVNKCIPFLPYPPACLPACSPACLPSPPACLPACSDAEVLSMFAVIINRLRGKMEAEVPRIFGAVFECTLQMITRNFEVGAAGRGGGGWGGLP